MKACKFWECISYNIQWGKTQTLKKFPSDKLNGTKSFLFSRVPIHHSFTFNLQFLFFIWAEAEGLSL